jgi:hypothetical protein
MPKRKARKRPRGMQGAILIADIDESNRPDRTDLDRTGNRTVLQDAILSSIDSANLKLDRRTCSDTGDGLLFISTPDAEKVQLLDKLAPALEREIAEHNRRSSENAKFRVRLTLHSGDYLTDSQSITGDGVVGREINRSFRILDSDVFRKWVRTVSYEEPLCVMVSDRFYGDIIEQQLPTMKPRFTEMRVPTKDKGDESVLKAWALDYVAVGGVKEGVEKVVAPAGEKRKPQLELRNLPSRCILLSVSDIRNYHLYSRLAGEVPLRSHLETALLLGNKVIIHCADPFRSESVLELLYEYQEFVASGDILFLMGSTIDDVKQDYVGYLRRKADQYLKSDYGDTDANEISDRLQDVDYLTRVMDLLDMNPFLLHRGFVGTRRFVTAVKLDLEKSERMVVCGSVMGSKLSNLNLSIFQLLNLEEIPDGGSKRKRVFAGREKATKLIDRLQGGINHKSFSRQILMNIFSEVLGPVLDEKAGCRDLLETRVNLLHLHMNVDAHTFLELSPERDANSPYYYQYLFGHLGYVTSRARIEHLGPRIVGTLRTSPAWEKFADRHLRLMSDIYARRLADSSVEPDHYFQASRGAPEFDEICKAFDRTEVGG